MSAYDRPSPKARKEINHERIKQSPGYKKYLEVRQALKESVKRRGRHGAV